MSYGNERVYRKIEVVGTSPAGIEGAIEAAVGRAHEMMTNPSWFEVQEVRGHIGENGRVSEYQVVLKVAFHLA